MNVLHRAIWNSITIVFVCGVLAACGTQEPAPVVDGWQKHAIVYPRSLPKQLPPKQVAPKSMLTPIKPAPPTSNNISKAVAPIPKQPLAAPSATGWVWPAPGVIVQNYNVDGNKGVNIAGLRNSPVLAARSGTVVYIGTGLTGYGKMIILKHSTNLLTAYAHNNEILVKEGQQVQAGQQIAKMGDTGATRVVLHFEVRKDGKPVDPLLYLPKRTA